MPGRILICRSNAISPDPRVEKIARTLASGGYQVRILGWDMSGNLPEQDDVAGVPCVRLRVRAKFGRGLSNLGHQLRWQTALVGWLIHHRKTFDLIHACDFDTVLPALLCKYVFGKKVIYDIFDFYADMLKATPGAVKWAIRRVDFKVIGWVDAVILADDCRREQIAGSQPRRLEVIYNSPEDRRDLVSGQIALPHNEVDSPALESPSSERGFSLKIAYTGGMSADRGLFELVEVVSRRPEWRLDLAGYGAEESRLAELAAQKPNIFWHGRLPHESALAVNAAADVLVATYSPNVFNNRFSSPNKLFEAMMLGKPILVARNIGADRIVAAERCGVVMDYGDLTAMEMALENLQSDPGLRDELGRNGRAAYERVYNWGNMKIRLLNLYRQVTGLETPPR